MAAKPYLEENLADIVKAMAPGIYDERAQTQLSQFVDRALNQNEQASGIFYLHPDGDVSIVDPSFALVRTAYCLPAKRYEALRVNRCGRLTAEFRDKLGYLSGQLYSRIGARDWPPEELKDLKASIMPELKVLTEKYYKYLETVLKGPVNSENLDTLRKEHPFPNVANRLEERIASMLSDKAVGNAKNIAKQIVQDPEIRKVLRDGGTNLL